MSLMVCSMWYDARLPFLLATGPILSFFFRLQGIFVVGSIVAKLLGFVNLLILLGPSSNCSEAIVTMAQHLPLATLCLPADDDGCSDVGAAAGLVEGKAPGVNEIGVIAIMEKEARSPLVVDPSFMGMIVTQAGGSVLTPHSEEVNLSEDPFVWPLLVGSREAPFEVNDAAEQATWSGAL